MTDTLLRIEDVERITTLSKQTVYRLMGQGGFPQPRKIGAISAWVSSEIQAWIDSLPVGIDKGIDKAA